jgi:hypothetical protein
VICLIIPGIMEEGDGLGGCGSAGGQRQENLSQSRWGKGKSTGEMGRLF